MPNTAPAGVWLTADVADSGWFCAPPGWAVLRKGCRTPQILPNRCCASTSFIGHALCLGTTAGHLIEEILIQRNLLRFRQCDLLLVVDLRVRSLPDTCLLRIQSNNVGAQVSARRWLLNITMHHACLPMMSPLHVAATVALCAAMTLQPVCTGVCVQQRWLRRDPSWLHRAVHLICGCHQPAQVPSAGLQPHRHHHREQQVLVQGGGTTPFQKLALSQPGLTTCI